MLGKLFRQLFAARSKAPIDAAVPRVAFDATMHQAREAMQAGHSARAIELFSHALHMAKYQNFAEATPDILANRAMCHALLGKLPEAEQDYNDVLERAPKHSEAAAMAHMNLGNIALRGHRFTEATVHYEASLAASTALTGHAPPSPGLLNNLGLSLHRRGLPELAIERYRQALTIQPDFQDASTNLLFAMQHTPTVSAEDLFKAFQDWSARHEAPLRVLQRPHANAPDPARKLRVGYLSGDFFRHAVANFIEPVLQAHDRQAVEVFCYATNSHADDQTTVLRQLADHWRDVAQLSDDDLAQRVRDDAIDILVDLSAHTLGHRLLVFARKPAPVQITWLGYPTTTGLHSMDYRISDAVSDPPGVADPYHSERILRLPRSQWCYRPWPQAPEVKDAPALRTGRVTFGSFNNLAKLNDRVLELWAKVLIAVPEASINVVSIPDIPSRHRVANALLHHGAKPEQVKITGTLEYDEFWRIRDDIDIVLDAFPYNGTTTTCEALWAGLPVITLAGSHGASRSAASILTSVGLSELVAHDAAAYVSIAQALARDVTRVNQLRHSMRTRLIEAGLCDGRRFTRELETAYRQAWQDWCKEHARPA
jgi:predicted O-linked N-acetylglucosamine transferase (SPINDLY family)